MYYIGTEFSTDGGGYKTIQQAKRQAARKGVNVYDEDGNQVYPETAVSAAQDAGDTTATAQAEETATAAQGTAYEGSEDPWADMTTTVTLTNDVPDGALDALDDNEDGSVNIYNAAGEKASTVSRTETEKLLTQARTALQEATAGTVTPISGTVKVVRKGMIALRNAAKWDAGHKCGVAKTGYTARAVARVETADGAIYKLQSGRYISGRDDDTVFTPDN